MQLRYEEVHPELMLLYPKVNSFKERISETYKPSKFLYFDLETAGLKIKK